MPTLSKAPRGPFLTLWKGKLKRAVSFWRYVKYIVFFNILQEYTNNLAILNHNLHIA